MATQTLTPDGILANSGFGTAPTTSNQSAQDANWATALSNTSDTSAQMSMPTPSGNPNSGANLQTITVQTRKTSSSGAGTPTATISVGVNGTKILTSSPFNITSTAPQTNSFTFDFSEVTGAHPSGSDIKVWVDTTASGGGPSVRAAADTGYVAWVVDYTAASPILNQSHTRFYLDDASESTSTPWSAEDGNLTGVSVTAGDGFLTLRVQLYNSGSGDQSATPWKIRCSKNGGAYFDLSLGSSNVKTYNSPNFSDGTSITAARLTSPGGSFVTGQADETGSTGSIGVTAGNYTEFLFAIQLVSADLSNGDTLDFRLTTGAGTVLDSYSVTPRITVSKSVSLSVQGASSAGTTGSPTLSPKTPLTVAAATSVSTAGNVVITPKYALSVANAVSASLASNVTFGVMSLAVASAVSAGSSGGPGSEMVPNGTFDTDTTNWAARNEATDVSWVGGRLRVTALSDTNVPWAWQGVTTEVGVAYQASGEVFNDPSGGAGRVRIGDAQNSESGGFIDAGGPSIIFVATATMTYFTAVLRAGLLTGRFTEFDNISLRKLGQPVTLSPKTSLVVANESSLSQAGSVVLLPKTSLTVANETSASITRYSGFTNITLGVGLGVQNATSASLAGAVILVPNLIVAAATSLSAASSPTLTPHWALAVSGARSLSTTGNVTIGIPLPTPSSRTLFFTKSESNSVTFSKISNGAIVYFTSSSAEGRKVFFTQ